MHDTKHQTVGTRYPWIACQRPEKSSSHRTTSRGGPRPAQAAGISTAWLYEHEAIKARIMHLRAQQVPKAKGQIPPREQASSASKDTMIAALQKRVREQAVEIEQLKRQVEVAYGLLASQRGESQEGTV